MNHHFVCYHQHRKNNLFRKNKGMLLKSFMTKESFIFTQAELLLQEHV